MGPEAVRGRACSREGRAQARSVEAASAPDPGLRRRTGSSPTRISATTTGCRARSSGCEAEIAADEAALHDPDLYARDPERFAELTERIARNRAEIEAAELRWLEVAEMAEALAAQ